MSQFANQAARNAALIPPDLYAEITDQFKDASLEVGGETLEQTEAAREATDDRTGKGGSAMFDGAPKPSPYDELGATVYQRDPDARNDAGLMVAAGLAATAYSNENEADASPAQPAATAEPQRGSFASMRAEQAQATPTTPAQEPESAPAPQRGSFASMKAEQADAPAPRPEQSRAEALMPSEIRAEVQNEGRADFQKAAENSTDRQDALLPPDIRAEVGAEQARTQQRQRAAGLEM